MILFLSLLVLLGGFIAFARLYFNTPLGWAISLTIWLTIMKASWFFFVILWLVCWNASDEQWRHHFLIDPIRSLVNKFFATAH